MWLAFCLIILPGLTGFAKCPRLMPSWGFDSPFGLDLHIRTRLVISLLCLCLSLIRVKAALVLLSTAPKIHDTTSRYARD